MSFLRDPAFQAAAFFIAILTLVLQFPQHMCWLVPVFLLFIVLLFIGHKLYPIDQSHTERNGNLSNKGLLSSLIFPVVQRWWSTVTLIIIAVVSIILTLSRIHFQLTRDPNACPPQHQTGWSERARFRVPADTDSLYLRTVVKQGRLFELMRCLDPEIQIQADPGTLFATVSMAFQADISFEEAGADPENRILEPVGLWQSSDDTAYESFSLEAKHTYFVRYKDTIIRLYVNSLSPSTLSPGGRTDTRLVIYLSYVPDTSQRFDGLTKPWYCFAGTTVCE